MTHTIIQADITNIDIEANIIEENITADLGYSEIIVNVDSWSSHTTVQGDIVEVVEPFAFGDATPKEITTGKSGKTIISVDIIILNVFDGVGATLSVGDADDHNRLMNSELNNPAVAEAYTSTPNYIYQTDTNIRLYINAGEGTTIGNGLVIIRSQF